MINRLIEQSKALDRSSFIWIGTIFLSGIFIFQGLAQLYAQQQWIRASNQATTPKAAYPILKTDSNSIMQAHLFGLAPLSSSRMVPISQLNWLVQGISMVFPDMDRSRVLLKINQVTKWYQVGDHLPDNVEIYGINRDHIILKRNGEYETLRLERKALQFSKPYQRGGAS